MRFFRTLIAPLLAVLLLGGCSEKKMTSDELFKKCASGVVLILNEYYYVIHLPNGNDVYFSNFDGESLLNLTADKSEIMQQRSVLFGTGFFVAKDGKILTNRHVAAPQLDLAEVKQSYKSLLKSIGQLIGYQQQLLSNQYDQLSAQIANSTYYDYYGFPHTDNDAVNRLTAQQQELSQQYGELESMKENLDMDVSELKIESVCELGVAYNNTYVTTENDFKSCVVNKVSDKENVDLALIQLKDKQTPEGAYVFYLPGEAPEKHDFWGKLGALFSSDDAEKTKLTVDQPLFMIGYNAGIQLANTSQGIKAQLTRGNVSQEPDDNRLLYTIPTLSGSSGSPVVDEYGNLVAVNFAKVSDTQNFNFGIVAKRIKEFLN